MDTIKAFNGLKKVDLEEFAALFESCKKEAFRLELLQQYFVEGEIELVSQHKKGLEKPDDFNSEWHSIIKKASERNCIFNRVRYIENPLTDYLKFEIDWGYHGNILSGENIFFITRIFDSFKNQVPILKDFWLFDEERLFFLEYDYFGRFMGATELQSKFLKPYIDYKNELIETCEKINNSEYWD